MQNQQAVASKKRSLAKRKKLWFAAIKWPIYSVAVMPIMIAGSWLIGEGVTIRIQQCIAFLVGSILLLLWENLTNDLFDAETGIDELNKPHSIVALTGGKQPIQFLANLVLAIGLTLILIVAINSSFRVFFLVLGSCLLGYLYQGPPFRLGYKGLGEPLCWIAFGPLATAAVLLSITPKEYYLNSIPWVTVLWLGAGPALATSLILFCSHFHQVSEDKKHGKMSPIVILGTKIASNLIPLFIALIFLLEWIPIFIKIWNWTALISVISLPSGISLIKLLKKNHNNPEKITESKFLALQFQFLNGLGLSIGLALSNLVQ